MNAEKILSRKTHLLFDFVFPVAVSPSLQTKDMHPTCSGLNVRKKQTKKPKMVRVSAARMAQNTYRRELILMFEKIYKLVYFLE